MNPPEQQLVYVADTMCSWCWGFAPVMEALQQRWSGRLTFKLVQGGLRPGPAAEIVDQRMKSYLRHHWDAVAERTGQPFDYTFFERDGVLYDTHPAAKAVVLVRELSPGKEWPYFHALQKAYYAGNRDITSQDVLADVAAEQGVDDHLFRQRFGEEAAEEATYEDYRRARALGVSGFPSLVLISEETPFTVCAGYQPLEMVERQLEALVTG